MKLKINNHIRFNQKTKIQLKTKIGVFFIIFIAISFAIFSFFIDIQKGYANFVDYNNVLSFEYPKLIYTPIGLIMAGLGIPAISCCLQITSKNKLAEPTTLGFYPVILLAIICSQIIYSSLWLKLLFGYFFCSIVVCLNLLLARNNIYQSNFKLVLIGFTLNGIFTGINWLLTTYVNISGVNPLDWLLGTPTAELNETSIIFCSCVILVCLIIIYILIPYFNIIQKDATLAKMLGINVTAIYWIVGILSVFISVSSLMIAGGIMLIGMVMPHLVRMIFNTNNNAVVIPTSGFLSIFLLISSNMLKNYINTNINLIPSILGLIVLFMLLKGKK